MSTNIVVIVFLFGFIFVSALPEAANDEREENVKCPHLPCPLPANCTHKVWSHFWYHGKLCKGCQYCPNNTNTNSLMKDEGSKCPHLPCPLPPNCTDMVWSYFWYHGILCKGCQYCPNITVITSPLNDEMSPNCPVLPCPPPFPGCAKFEMSHFRYHGKLCPGCEQCVYWNISQSSAVRQVQEECPVFKCPAPGHCLHLAYHTVTIPGVPLQCRGCPYCVDQPLLLKRLSPSQTVYCPDVACAQPGQCGVTYKVATMTFMGNQCPGCPYCPITNA